MLDTLKTLFQKLADFLTGSYFIPVSGALIALACIAWSISFQIEPFSDFALYWSTANDLSNYVKGGALLLIFRPFSAFGIEPNVACGVIHAFFWMVFSYAIWDACRWVRNQKGFASGLSVLTIHICYICFAIIWIPLSAFAEVMLVHTSIYIFALWLVAKNTFLSQQLGSYMRRPNVWLGGFLLALALTMRAQSILITIGMICVLIAVNLASKDRERIIKFCLVIFCAVFTSAGSELFMTAKSNDRLGIKMNQRVPLYAG